jgi:hypothetical protein
VAGRVVDAVDNEARMIGVVRLQSGTGTGPGDTPAPSTGETSRVRIGSGCLVASEWM